MKNLKSHAFNTQLSPEPGSYPLSHEGSRHFHISSWMLHYHSKPSVSETELIFLPQHIGFIFAISVSAVDFVIF